MSIEFAVMRWLNDGNRLSVHNLKHVIEPKRPHYHDYKPAECGVALFPGFPGKWTFRILAIGAHQEMDIWLNRNMPRLLEDVEDLFLFEEKREEEKSEEEKSQEKDGMNVCVNSTETLKKDKQKTQPKQKKKTDICVNSTETLKTDKQKTQPKQKEKTDICVNSTEKSKQKEKTDDMLIQQSQKELATSLLKRPRESSESANHGINELKDELRRLKKRVRDLEKVNEKPPSSVKPSSSYSLPSTFSPPSSCNPPSTFSIPSSFSPPSSPPPSFRPFSPPSNFSPPSSPPPSFRPFSPPSNFSPPSSPPPSFRPPSNVSPLSSSPSQLTALESANVGVEIYNGKTLQALVDSVCHVDALFNCCHVLLTSLFTRDYIVTHSVTGQKANNASQPKPKFDQRLYIAMVNVLKEKFPGLKDTEITAKVHAVQKKNKTAIQMANGSSSRR